MRRNPLFTFKDRNSIGVYEVPLRSTIHILNDNGRPRFVEIISKEGLTGSSTIGEFLDNPDLYIDLSALGEIPSELERIIEGGQVGWRILGRDPQNYGNIGSGAIDLSESTEATDINGATGAISFAVGKNTHASGNISSAFGEGTLAANNHETVVGKYNDESDPSSIFTVGIGGSDYDKKNGLQVRLDGSVLAPELTSANLANQNADPHTLTTKEYVDDVDGGSIV
jgi:hypothetical protein